MNRAHRARLMACSAIVAGLTLATAGCGDDEEGAASASTTAEVAPEAPTADASRADPAEFCAAELEIEQASNDENADLGPLIGAAAEVVPADVADAFDAVIAAAQTGDTESDAFTVPYAEMIGWVADNCGYPEVETTLTEYKFEGVPDELPSGPTIFSVTNSGNEFHEMIMFRRLPGTTEPVGDLMTLPDEELFSKIAFAGAIGPTAQDATGQAVVDLTPGEYFAVCFLPVGTMSMTESGDDEIDGADNRPNHLMQGMTAEFSVSS